MHLACQAQPSEVYILGYDLSSYDKPLNNIYKGTDNYLPADTKGFNPDNWYNQMKDVFRGFFVEGIDFFLVDSTLEFDNSHVKHITKDILCERLQII